MLSNKEIRQIVKRHLGDKPISKEVIENIKKRCSECVNEICKSVVDDFKENNRIRVKQNLPRLRRLQVFEYKNLLDRTNKLESDFCMGVAGQYNKDTAISKKQNIEVV
jgi:hypothetical protein